MAWNKYLIALIISFIGFGASAQIFCYCTVTERNNKVSVEFSNNPVYISEEFQQQMLCDIETQKPIVFKNATDCINHLGLYGWKVVTSTKSGKTTKYTLCNQLESPYHSKGKLERDMRILEEYQKSITK